MFIFASDLWFYLAVQPPQPHSLDASKESILCTNKMLVKKMSYKKKVAGKKVALNLLSTEVTVKRLEMLACGISTDRRARI